MKKIITVKDAKFYKPKSKPDKQGIKVEMEHTPQKRVARIISGNHIDEHKGYYPVLKKMESKSPKKKGK